MFRLIGVAVVYLRVGAHFTKLLKALGIMKMIRNAFIGSALTLVAASIAQFEMRVGLPLVLSYALSVFVVPMLWIGSAITYFTIAGDDYIANRHFWPCVVPFSMLANSVLVVCAVNLWAGLSREINAPAGHQGTDISKKRDPAATILLLLSFAAMIAAIVIPFAFSVVLLPLSAICSLAGVAAAMFLRRRGRFDSEPSIISLMLALLNGLLAAIALACVLVSIYFWSTFEGPG